MCPRIVVVAGVSPRRPSQVCRAQNHDVVEAFPPDRTDQPLNIAIVPRRAACDWPVTDARDCQSLSDLGAVEAILIADQIMWSLIPRESLSNLPGNPFRCRVCCYADPDQLSPIQPNDHQGVEQIKAKGRHDKQVHRRNVWGAVTQKDSLPLAWRTAPFDHVLGSAGLRYSEAQAEQLSVNSRSARQRILLTHLPDQSP